MFNVIPVLGKRPSETTFESSNKAQKPNPSPLGQPPMTRESDNSTNQPARTSGGDSSKNGYQAMNALREYQFPPFRPIATGFQAGGFQAGGFQAGGFLRGCTKLREFPIPNFAEESLRERQQ